VGLKLLDYTKIVKQPMDLGTVKRKLDNNSYDEPEEVYNDVKLMLDNCYLYNPPTHDVVKMGKKLAVVFEKRYDNFKKISYEIWTRKASSQI